MHAGVMLLLLASAAPLTPKQAAEVQKIERTLVAPCCYTQSIAEHMSDVAEEMRQEVTQMVASGESQQDILNHYQRLYGKRVLIVPDGMTGELAFLIPLLVFATATVAVVFILRRMLRPGETTGQRLMQSGDPRLAAFRRQIQAEVEEFF